MEKKIVEFITKEQFDELEDLAIQHTIQVGSWFYNTDGMYVFSEVDGKKYIASVTPILMETIERQAEKLTFEEFKRLIIEIPVKGKIKAVSEAFSMQPITFAVGAKCPRVSYNNPPDNPIIDRIELATVSKEEGRAIQVYEGYDKDNNILFELIASSVNVFYF